MRIKNNNNIIISHRICSVTMRSDFFFVFLFFVYKHNNLTLNYCSIYSEQLINNLTEKKTKSPARLGKENY